VELGQSHTNSVFQTALDRFISLVIQRRRIHKSGQQYVVDRKKLTNDFINALECEGNYSATSNNMKLHGTPAVDEWAVTFGTATGRGRSPPKPLLAVPNIIVHPSAASVGLPITVLLYNGPLLSGFSVSMVNRIIALWSADPSSIHLRMLFLVVLSYHYQELHVVLRFSDS